jgi:uncharacterized protein (DUF2141 family)
MTRLLGLLSALFFATALPMPRAAEAPRASPATGQIQIEVAGLHSDTGQLRAALFRSANGFPKHPEQAFARTAVRIEHRRVALMFEQVPAGPFAISLFHDADNDDKLKTNLFGMPLEGYGFSRDARGHMGPPSFDAARLALAAGEHKHLIVHMEY